MLSTSALADSVATEVTAADATEEEAGGTSADEATTAIEVPALEELSFRDGGEELIDPPVELAGISENPNPEAVAAGPERQIDASLAPDTSDDEWNTTLDGFYGAYADSTGYGYPAAGYGATGTADSSYQPDGDYDTGLSQTECPGWTIDGSVTIGSGSATYADNDYQEFSLRETLELLNGDRYEFYQEYAVDHSYFNSNTFTVGARQRLRNWLANGDLRLTEEFKLYRDNDRSSNDRQEGYFALRFDPEWYSGRLEADVDYKYRIRVYETFSTRSYIHHSARTGVSYELTPDVETEVRLRFDDYNYSYGSTRSNNRHSVSNEWEWQATPEVRIGAGVEQERKNYNTTKNRTYDKRTYEAGARWDYSRDGRIELKGELIDYDREFDPEESYEDTRTEVRLRHDLAEWADVDLRASERQKEYNISPTDDLDQSAVDFRLNLNPGRAWNIFASLGETQYDYTLAIRAFKRRDAGLGVNYRMGDFRAGADYFNRDFSFDSNTTRDYSRDDFNLNLDYGFNEQRWRVYYGIGELDQDNPASVNGYSETRAGALWDYRLDCKTQLKLKYEFSERDYDALRSIDYSLLEAKLEFEL